MVAVSRKYDIVSCIDEHDLVEPSPWYIKENGPQGSMSLDYRMPRPYQLLTVNLGRI